MVKVRDKRKLKWCLVNYDSGKITQKWASKHLEITPRRFRQLHQQFKTTGKIPDIGINNGRPRKTIDPELKRIIKQAYEKDQLNASVLGANHLRPPGNIYSTQYNSRGFA
jgi:hypothetical protein